MRLAGVIFFRAFRDFRGWIINQRYDGNEPRNTRNTRKGAFKSVNGGIAAFETIFPRTSQKSPWPCGPSPFGKGDNSFSILSLAYPLADVGCYAVHSATDPRRIRRRRRFSCSKFGSEVLLRTLTLLTLLLFNIRLMPQCSRSQTCLPIMTAETLRKSGRT